MILLPHLPRLDWTKQQENIFKKMEKAKSSWIDFIDISFLNDQMKFEYKQLLETRFKRIYPDASEPYKIYYK
jgi:hypothetical protein